MRKLFFSVVFLWGIVLFFPLNTQAQQMGMMGGGVMGPVDPMMNMGGMGGMDPTMMMLGQQQMMHPMMIQQMHMNQAAAISGAFHWPGSQPIGLGSYVPPLGLSTVINKNNFNTAF